MRRRLRTRTFSLATALLQEHGERPTPVGAAIRFDPAAPGGWIENTKRKHGLKRLTHPGVRQSWSGFSKSVGGLTNPEVARAEILRRLGGGVRGSVASRSNRGV